MSAPPALPPAGLGRRFAALVYELLLVTAIVLVTGFAALPLVSPGASGALAMPGPAQRVILFCLEFAVLAGYFTWSWSRGRRTLPMKTWRLGLALPDGAPGVLPGSRVSTVSADQLGGLNLQLIDFGR